MSLAWRDQLSVGNDLIDTDHQHLIDIINLAEASLRVKDTERIAGTLAELAKYSRTHFVREEQVAAGVGYPGVAQLHQSHSALLERLQTTSDKVSDDWSPALIDEFTTFLRDWFINHVIKEDMLMKPYLKKFSPRFDPR